MPDTTQRRAQAPCDVAYRPAGERECQMISQLHIDVYTDECHRERRPLSLRDVS